MKKSEKYPDYDDLVGFHLAASQIGAILRHKSVRATRGELTHREYLAELIEFLSHAEGTFQFDALEPNRSTARFGRQVQDAPGHALFLVDEDYLEQRKLREENNSHPAAPGHVETYKRLLATDDAAYDDLIEDVLAIARDFERQSDNSKRDALLEELLDRLTEEHPVVVEDEAGHDGRVDFSDTFNEATGIGLFRPDPEVMHDEPDELPDPALGSVAVDGQTLRATDVVLPEGGYVALVATTGQPLTATDYLDAGTYDEITLTLEEADAADALVMLFKGEPDATFDLTNTPYTADGRPFRREVAL